MEAKIFHFTQNGLEPVVNKQNHPVGTKIFAFGAGMSQTIWSIYDNNNHIVKISKNYDDDYFVTPYNTLEKYARPISKKFGIGFYYDETGVLFTLDEINEAKKRADLFIIEMENKKQAKLNADNLEISNLPQLFPYLNKTTDTYDQKQTKSNLIAALKHNFPNTKFSVKKDNYDTYNVSWINGASQNEVTKICNMFEDHESSYCGDFRDFNPSNFNKVFGGFKYVFESREYCDKINELYNGCNDYDLNRKLNTILNNLNIPVDFISCSFDGEKINFELAEKKEVKKDLSNLEIQIIDYSEKAIAIIGNTKEVKEILKGMGGRFNFNLQCGAGWIFPKTKKELLINTLNL